MRRLLDCFMLVMSFTAFAGESSQWELSAFFSYDGVLNYRLYSQKGAASKRPLVLALHGCNQTLDQFIELTRLTKLADEEGFAVLFPDQSLLRNTEHCWNWFLPSNQIRGQGELAMIHGLMRMILQRGSIDASQIYVIGFSSGGAMAANLASCYPDVFAGVGIHSGVPYRAVTSLLEVQEVLIQGTRVTAEESATLAFDCAGKKAQPLIPAIVFHGEEDVRVNPAHGALLFLEFVRFNDLLDDGKLNQTFPDKEISVRHGSVDGGHRFEIRDATLRGAPWVRWIQVDGMGHLWSGGDPHAPRADPLGPDATQEMWKFFKSARARQ